MAMARALWIMEAGKGVLRASALPTPGDGEVQVRTLFSGISRGTEALVFAGAVPDSEQLRMRGPHQEGEFGFPIKYGYCAVGVVEAGAPDCLGQPVLCLHPHQTRFIVPRAAAHVLPPGLPPGRAILAPQVETALNAVWDAAPLLGDRIAVVGGGVIGCLVAWLCARLPATRVTLVDPDRRRAKLARSLGAAWSADGRGCGDDHDLVFHASGTEAGLDGALALAGFEARVIELSWHGRRPVRIGLGGAFHSRRLSLQSSQVSHVAAARRARRTPQERLALAMRLAADPRLDALLREEVAFDHLPEALPRILGEAGSLMVRVLYPEAAD